jgi:hypothetical protein
MVSLNTTYHAFYLICILNTKGDVTTKDCMLIFSTHLSDIFRILGRIQLDVFINVHRILDKVPVILVRV